MFKAKTLFIAGLLASSLTITACTNKSDSSSVRKALIKLDAPTEPETSAETEISAETELTVELPGEPDETSETDTNSKEQVLKNPVISQDTNESDTSKKTAELCLQELCADATELSVEKVLATTRNTNEATEKYFNQHFEKSGAEALTAHTQEAEALLKVITSVEKDLSKTELSADQLLILSALTAVKSTENLKAINEALKTDVLAKASEKIYSAGYLDYFTTLHGDMKSTAALIAEASEVLKLQKEINTKFKAPLVQIPMELLLRAQSGEVPSADQLKQLVGSSYRIRALHMLTIKNTDLMKNYALSADKLKAAYKTESKKSLELRSGAVKKLESELKTTLTKGLQSYATSSQNLVLTATADQVVRVLVEGLSEKDTSRKVLQEMDFVLAPTNDVVVKSWAKYLKALKENSVANTSLINQLDEAGKVTLALANSQTNTYWELDLKKLVDSDNLAAEKIGSKEIRLPWIAARADNLDLAVSMLTTVLSDSLYQADNASASAKQCLTAKTQSENEAMTAFRYIQAAKVIQNLQKNLHNNDAGKIKNLGCFNKSASGAILIGASLKKQIPASCNEFLKETKQVDVESCSK